MVATTLHVLVALLLPTHVPDFIKLGRAIVTAMTGNAHFPTPTPTLASVTTALDALDTAETVAKNRGVGTATARNTKLVAARTLLVQLKAYVQQIADTTPDQAAAIIESAGMSVAKKKTRQKQTNTAKIVAAGIVDLFAVVAAHATAYEWQQSTDNKTWTTLVPTSKSRTTVSGLVSGQVYWFRSRPVLRKGAADWCQSFSLLVS